LLCTSRKLQYCVTCVKKKCAERTKPFTPRKCLNLRLCAHGNVICFAVRYQSYKTVKTVSAGGLEIKVSYKL
jgi:hypothetical protein